jgi:hypothetical protein
MTSPISIYGQASIRLSPTGYFWQAFTIGSPRRPISIGVAEHHAVIETASHVSRDRYWGKTVPAGFELTPDEAAYRAQHGLDLEQMAWRRAKIVELNGVHNFRREYPATPEEAFSAEVPGALWKRDQIDNLRVLGGIPELKRIVVAVDPSGGDKARNDEIGLVVVGIDAQKHGFVLADRSGRYTPEAWGSLAVALYRQFKADRIVAEANFGGAMVESTIRVVDRSAPVKLVHASRGKQARAEPVAALYEQGRMHHWAFPSYARRKCR